jgi:trehalose synthase
VLAGGSADDDPEGEAVLDEVRRPPPATTRTCTSCSCPRTPTGSINALQRASDLVIQKSTREGFGLTVTEAMWKGKPGDRR